ncbi:MAG: radical SAM family heme chaperone HemW [bacterium]|nr:radical SAM family heme chaperone HemW [bacterium]
MENLSDNKAQNIYIHIPFCIRKCNYCSFISFTNIAEYQDAYIEALCKEIASYASAKTIETVYLGGGTPNLLSIKSLEKITATLDKSFRISDNVEFSMEFNPKISNLQYVQDAKALGINRISLGAQSFNDDILKTLGRIHTANDTLKFIEILNKAQIDNYSVDLMYGIFGQDIKSLKNDLDILTEISPKHVSTYGLKVEDGTPFAKLPKENLPDEDMCASMYLLICNELKNKSYEHYEISNFAQKGYSSKHNMAYWKNKEYFGVGVAAHGYLNGTRYKNSNDIKSYIQTPIKKEIIAHNSQQDILEEEIFLGLRTSDGINLKTIKEKFGTDLYKEKKAFINEIIGSGHGNIEGDIFSLTEKGFLISNYILGELVS